MTNPERTPKLVRVGYLEPRMLCRSAWASSLWFAVALSSLAEVARAGDADIAQNPPRSQMVSIEDLQIRLLLQAVQAGYGYQLLAHAQRSMRRRVRTALLSPTAKQSLAEFSERERIHRRQTA